MTNVNPLFMQRCLELAENGSGNVAPNPLVGCVIVHDNKIIGEGFHRQYGEPHAEVNAINDAVSKGNEHLLNESTLYVSLEPCNHHGKTPPCTLLILKHKIPHVIFGCEDPSIQVNGKGAEMLRSAGVKVEPGTEREKCLWINRRFITFHLHKRPFVLLKFAKTHDNYLAPLSTAPNKKISSHLSDVVVHKWRSEESAILIGTITAEQDNPELTVRKWKGKNPVRVVVDRNLRLRNDLHLFDQSVKTIVINEKKNESTGNISYLRVGFTDNLPKEILAALYAENISSVMVEGGSRLLEQFIRHKLWDEARIITSQNQIYDGLKAPELSGLLISTTDITEDRIDTFIPQ